MDKKSKTLFVILLFIGTLSVAATYYKYVYLNDYEVFFSEEDLVGEEE